MDIREEIIFKVAEALQELMVDGGVIDIVQDVLTLELNEYEVQERCTAVAVQDYSAEGMLRKFIATKRVEGKARTTLQRYWDMNLKLIRFLRKQLYEVTTYDLRFYLSFLRQQGRVSNRTLDGMRRCFSSFFGWLSAEGLIGRNPCAALAQIKFRKVVKKPYSAVEVEKLRRACATGRDLALIDFLLATGCRVSEVVRLDVYDVDFDSGEVTVLGKGDKERVVYLTPVALMNLKEYVNGRRSGAEALFAGKGTGRLQKGGIEAAVKRIAIAAGVADAYPHRFRRTLATNLLDRGMDIQDVAEILGHVDLKTTKIYCFTSRKNVRTAYFKYAA